MADLINVLLVDDNKELCNLIREKLDGSAGINTIGIAADGVSAISMIRESRPDVVLLDMIMPNLDGLGVLEWIAGEKTVKRPLIIVFTAIGGDIVIQKALELGADYYMMKPVDTDVLVSRIMQLFNESHRISDHHSNTFGSLADSQPAGNCMEQIITELIRSMGVTPNLAGYSYLREAVMLAAEEPDRLKSVSRNIYSELARNHNTNARNVDRAIRCAIDSAHKKTKSANNPVQNEYMASSSKKRPNNAQIISFLYDMAARRYKCE